MVKRLQREIPGIRIAVIAHGDYCDGPNVVTIMDFSNNEKMLCDFVMNIPKTSMQDVLHICWIHMQCAWHCFKL